MSIPQRVLDEERFLDHGDVDACDDHRNVFHFLVNQNIVIAQKKAT